MLFVYFGGLLYGQTAAVAVGCVDAGSDTLLLAAMAARAWLQLLAALQGPARAMRAAFLHRSVCRVMCTGAVVQRLRVCVATVEPMLVCVTVVGRGHGVTRVQRRGHRFGQHGSQKWHGLLVAFVRAAGG